MGISVALIVRILLFLAVLGVVTACGVLDTKDLAGSSFQIGAGAVGHKIFGVVFMAAALTSIVGAAYTSVSFLKTLFKVVDKNQNLFTIGFILVSTLTLIFIGKPAKLMIIAGALNGLILPITLATVLIASNKKDVGRRL